MLADQDHPLEDAIAESEAKPDPAVVVVYRTRGVPWLLVPPLLLLAGVAAIVVYRRSEHASARAAALAWQDATAQKASAAGSPKPDNRAQVEALDELTFATGRATSAPAPQAVSPVYDPTPPPDAPEPPKPAPAPVEPVRTPEKPKVEPVKPAVPAPAPANPTPKPSAPAPTPKPTEPKPTQPKPAEPKPAATPAPAVTTASAAPARPNAVADPFDPLVEIPEPAKPVAIVPPPAAEPTARRDRVGFDPQATPATLEAEAEPKREPEPPAVDRPPSAVVPPAGEQPFELDRRPPAAAGRAADRRAEQTQEIFDDMQAEAERKLAERAHLIEIKNGALNPDPAEHRLHREALKAAARRLAAEDRQPFHEELKRLIREQGRAAGPDILAARKRFGDDTVPEIMKPAARDLIEVGSRLTTGDKIRRMRQWGLPEAMIIDDLYDKAHQNIGGRGGPRDEGEAWVYAAWTLLHYPPGVPREPAARGRGAPLGAFARRARQDLVEPPREVECVPRRVRVELERVMPLGILDDPRASRADAVEIGPRPGVVDDPVVPGEHEQRRLPHHAADLPHAPVDEPARGQQRGRRGPQAQWVGGDEGLALGAVGEERGVGQGNREPLAAVREEGQRDPQPLGPIDVDPRVQARADQGEGVDQLGMPRRRDDRELAAPANAGQCDRRRRVGVAKRAEQLGNVRE